jgi:hypothetical protein
MIHVVHDDHPHIMVFLVTVRHHLAHGKQQTSSPLKEPVKAQEKHSWL